MRKAILPRGIRNNNPGNIEFNPAQFDRDPWVGELGPEPGDGRFSRFDTMAHGVRAMAKILVGYQERYGLDTVAQIIGRWAPGHENPTDKYAAFVAKRMGLFPDDVSPGEALPRFRDAPEVLVALTRAMIDFENGPGHVDGATVWAGVRMALGLNETMEA